MLFFQLSCNVIVVWGQVQLNNFIIYSRGNLFNDQHVKDEMRLLLIFDGLP